jgi:DNA ligase-1
LVSFVLLLLTFDSLYVNGKSLLREDLTTRRQELKKAFISLEHEFYFATYLDSKNPDEIEAFLNESVSVYTSLLTTIG